MRFIDYDEEGDFPYLLSFDPEAFNGLGKVSFTRDRSRAMQFSSQEAVIKFWGTQSQRVPFREDGKPNKPLTALTIMVDGDDELQHKTPVNYLPC